jgi:alanine racemase
MLRRYAKHALRRLTSNDFRPLNHIELSRANMLQNVALVQRQHPGAEIIPVLKGNAYGHGIEQVAEILHSSPVRWLAVDGYFEAAKIRDVCKQRLLVLGYIRPENTHLLDSKRCSFGALGKPVQIHLELNTGMNRLGLQTDELDAYLSVLREYPKLELEGVMSHLADADNADSQNFSHYQSHRFDTQVAHILAAGFTPKLIHLANTAGSVKAASKYANALRLGIGLYGINPLVPQDGRARDLAKLKPVLTLKSTIIKVVELRAGDKISYNGTFVAPKTMRIGVLPLGYYEGVPRQLSNKGKVTHGRAQLPIVGRVCMNHTLIDLRSSGLQVNDEVTVISAQPSLPNSMSRWQADHGLFPYTSCTGLSNSIRRELV